MRLAAALACAAALPPGWAEAGMADPTVLTLEELLDARVYSASKFAERTTEAPAAVTVVTADDIRVYGYRTLADLLRGVRGFFVTYDRNYAYVGVRGFERPGDYGARLLLMLDGHRLNEVMFDTAGSGTEFPVDVDLIERVEIVRGPGSAIYGSNAFFAVINVVSRRGADVGPVEASGELGSFGSDRERLSAGGQSRAVADWLLSASRHHSDGQDWYDPEFGGTAHDLDGEDGARVLGRVAAAGFTLTGVYSERDKRVPTAAYGTQFDDPRFETRDQWEALNLDYARALSRDWELVARAFHGSYYYAGTYPYGPPPIVLNRDGAEGRWWGSELRVGGRTAPHRIVGGVEYQRNYRQDMFNYDEDPYALYLDDRRRSDRTGAYVEDQVDFGPRLRASVGVRFDHYSTAGDAANPRAALLWYPRAGTTLKLLAGTAFRAPNNYELYYGDSLSLKANPALEPERITTFEVVGEQQVGAGLRLTADVYYNRIRNLIDQVIDPADGLSVFRNIGRVEAAGAEVEVERVWRGDARLRASYALQRTRDKVAGHELANSPRHLATLNATAPLLGRALRTGLELQYMARRSTVRGGETGDTFTVNLTVVSRPLANRLELSAGVYNLLDGDHADPGRPEHVQDQIPQDGRNFRVKVSYGL